MKTIKTFAFFALLFMAPQVQAQSVLDKLGSVLQGVAGNSGSSSTVDNVLSTVTNVISSKLTPTSTQIVGTWAYQSPAVMFTSDNALKSVAAKTVSSAVEKKLQTYLTKQGFTKGKTTITFDSNKNFTINRSGKTVASGTYTLSNTDVTLQFKGRQNPCKVTPQLEDGSLVIVMDATKLKNFMVNVGSNVSQLSTVTSLLKQVNGMKVGIRLSK